MANLKEKRLFFMNKIWNTKIILLINFIFAQTYFLIASSQIFKNDAILINHESFFKRKDLPQLHRFWFSQINSLMAEMIKKQFFKENFYKQIAVFDNNEFNFKNRNLFLKKMDLDLLESHHF